MAKILIVDDAKFSRFVVGKIVTDAGHTVLEAANGREGLEIIEKESGLDCIVTDLLMPELDGIGLLTAILEKKINIPVIVTTANIQENVRQKCLDLGAAAFINKPPKKEKLLEIIGNVT